MRTIAVTSGLFALLVLALAMTTRVRIVGGGEAATGDAVVAHRAASFITTSGSGAARPDGASTIAAPQLTMPVQSVDPARIADSWGDPRDNGLRPHHGTDIAAPANAPVVAAASGLVEKLHWSVAGGLTVYVRSPDRRWSYYYAHLSSYAPGLHEGQVLKVGDPVGYVGDTGNAGVGNYHLHFGLSRMSPRDGWWQGQPVDPYPSLAGKRTRG